MFSNLGLAVVNVQIRLDTMIDAVRIPLTGERSTKDGHPCPG